MDSGPRALKTHPEKRKTSQSRIQCNTHIRDEAIAQWEVAKDLGMTSGKEQSEIIDKITSMEIRGRKEAEVLGKRTNSS